MENISDEGMVFHYEKKGFLVVPIFIIGLLSIFYSLWYFNFTVINASWTFRRFIGVFFFIYTSYIFWGLYT